VAFSLGALILHCSLLIAMVASKGAPNPASVGTSQPCRYKCFCQWILNFLLLHSSPWRGMYTNKSQSDSSLG